MRWTSIDELTATIDALIAAHDGMAAELGEWCRTTDDPALAPVLAGDAAQHAWHAELWRGRRPVVTGRDGPPPTPAPRRPGRDAAYGSALDDLVEHIERLLAGIDPVVDAPTARTVELVLTDLRAQRRRAWTRGAGGR